MNQAPPTANDFLIDQSPIQLRDLGRVRSHYADVAYSLGDLDGDQAITDADVGLAQGIIDGTASAPCPRALDFDFDNQLTQDDLDFLESVVGYNELLVEVSPHLDCTAFAPISIRSSAIAVGQNHPILLLGSLRVGEAHNTEIEILSGPGYLEPFGTSGQDFIVTALDDEDAEGQVIEIAVHTGYEDFTVGFDEPTTGRSYRIDLEVIR